MARIFRPAKTAKNPSFMTLARFRPIDRCISTGLLIGIVFSGALTSFATGVTLTLQEAASEFNTYGTVHGVNLVPYDDGAGVTGQIQLNFDDLINPTSFTIVTSPVASVYSVPHDYGSRASGVLSNYQSGLIEPGDTYVVKVGVFGGGTLSSAPIALTGSAGNYTFDPSAISFTLTNLELDYDAETGGTYTDYPRGELTAPGLVVVNTATGSGTLTLTGSDIFFSAPLTLAFEDVELNNDAFTADIYLVGTLTATGAIPEPSAYAPVAGIIALLATCALRRRRK
jgi:hypothetical protein